MKRQKPTNRQDSKKATGSEFWIYYRWHAEECVLPLEVRVKQCHTSPTSLDVCVGESGINIYWAEA